MSIKLGKTKNWGSRSGTKSKQSKGQSVVKNSLSKLPTDVLKALIEDTNGSLSEIETILRARQDSFGSKLAPVLKLETAYGKLYQGDCISFLQSLPDNHIDCIFADPPFNLRKEYADSKSDNLPEEEYLEWTRKWLELCSQKLKLGGSFFIYNIPKWAIPTADFLGQTLTFRDWISVDLTLSMPIPGRLYPSHYSLLYFVKGPKPKTFNPPRLPIKTCVRCGQEQNDYGGYKNKMNPNGVNLRDVWTDIPPVRHSKYKNRDANELSLKMLDRVLDIATQKGDLVFDPFGGSGTTFVASELKGRKWIGTELGACGPILERFADLKNEAERLEKYRKDINTLFTDRALQLRHKSGLPLNNYNVDEKQIARALNSKVSRLSEIDL